jgi:AAA domain
MTSAERYSSWADAGIVLPPGASGEIAIQCPQCSADRKKKTLRCLSVNVEKGTWLCQHCDWRGGLTRVNGTERPHTVATYDYTDEAGELLFQVCRTADKQFPQRRPDGRGGWTWATKGVRRVLYRLPDTRRAIEAGETIYLAEGEKDVNSVVRLGLAATTSPGGASKDGQRPKWRDEYTTMLSGAKRVVLLPDNDEPGRAHMAAAAASLRAAGIPDVRTVELPGLPEHGDVSDWLAQGGTVEKLRELVEQHGEQPDPRIRETLAAIRTGNDLRRMEIAPVTWAVEGLIPSGVGIVAGKPKVKKSWMMLGISIALACGGKALGGIEVNPADVLYLSLEDGDRRLKRRVNILARDMDLSRFHYVTQWPRLTEGGIEALEAWLQAHSEARMVIIDTLQKVRPPGNPKASLFSNDYIVGELLIPLAEKYDVAIVLITHVRKMDAEDPIDLISGSLGLSAGVDGYMVLRRSPGQPDMAFLTVVGRDLDEDRELALKWHQQTATWHIEGDAERFKLSPEQRRVVELLIEHGPLDTKALAERLHPGITITSTKDSREYDATKKLCYKLQAKDHIYRRTFDKRWIVTPTNDSPTDPTDPSNPSSPDSPTHGWDGGIVVGSPPDPTKDPSGSMARAAKNDGGIGGSGIYAKPEEDPYAVAEREAIQGEDDDDPH